MRFPTATGAEVRHEISRQLRGLPQARSRFWLSVLVLSLGAAASMAVPLLLGRVVDVVLDGGDVVGRILWIGIAVSLAAIASAALNAAGFYILSTVAERAIANLREDMVDTALHLPTHRVEEAGSGDLLSRSTDDVAELSSSISDALPAVTSAVFVLIATAITLVGLDPYYLVVPLFAAPAYYLSFRQYLKSAPERYAKERASMAERATRVLESIHGLETLHAFQREDRAQASIGDASYRVVENGYSARSTMMVTQAQMAAIELGMLVAGLAMSYLAVRGGQLTIGEVTGAMMIIIRIKRPMMGIIHTLDTLNSGYASLARIVGVVHNPPPRVPDCGAPPPQGRIDLEDVWFSYDGNWAVRDIDLRVAPGEKVALVGASGAGKSTVAALIAGLRVPDSGLVLIDGTEVTQLSDSERVARLALVSQDVHVFSGTLREDMTVAKPDASDDELCEALDAVGAEWYREFPDGLDTVVGSRGERLDPVQAQQLALARVFLMDPAIVVMDEATAEAGSAGAGALEDAASVITDGRSSVVIAHRLDQAADADLILVMDAGEIVERGTHEELLAVGGRYAKLWGAWSRGRG
ncbi:ABC transporter ATP-binding protein [Corynebacterium sp. CNCTC7651]|uniref:ABC transporter ATP-binding protein n=1 Tax=Corynebacterium sp. CNCTC7651 TaxID=2815361 RepID=UPI001F1CA9F0|nr:ABC transporter ATP-binding protein [Corynebacterium sp. CNCTC7651]UIZ92778.1 ABC transporter ATP-binding protein [Corynebacterium sp. CNCTC7651]